jgi:hypothetical protein
MMHVPPIERSFIVNCTFVTFLLLFMLTAAACVYQIGLWGPYVFDDYSNIVLNGKIHITSLSLDSLRRAGFTGDSGPLGRPISMLSFALNYYFTGLNQYYFKLTNLVIHLINGLGIYALTGMLLAHYRREFQPALTPTHGQWISLAVAAVWLLHPFNLTGVLYVVQRMTSLSTLFCILGLIVFLWGRIRLLDGRKWGLAAIFVSVMVFTPLAALSKEIGALLPLFMFVLEVTLFRFRTSCSSARRGLIAFHALFFGIPALFTLVFLATIPGWLMAGYINRDFTLAERVLTEPRVLWFYLRQIVLPDTSGMGLFHDDLPISRSLTLPVTTLPALLGIALLLALVPLLRNRAPLLSFGLLFFFAGHVLESTIFALELVYEHRNYLPMLGIILPMFYYLLHPASPRTLALRGGVALLVIALFAYDTAQRATQWANPFDFKKWEVIHHPESPRANDEMGNVFESIRTDDTVARERNLDAAEYYYSQSTAASRTYVNGLFDLIRVRSARHKPIEQHLIAELASRLEHAPTANDTDLHLQDLVTCQSSKTCSLTRSDFDALFRASLANPTCQGQSRAGVLSAKAVYQVNIEKAFDSGLGTMREMVAATPWELENRMTLIKYLIALRRLEEATNELNVADRMDTRQTYSSQIASLRKKINSLAK